MKQETYDTDVFSELFDVQPQAICWLAPVRKPGSQEVVDFEFAYCNDEGLRYLNLTREQQKGMLLSQSPTVTDELRSRFFNDLVQVLDTGNKVESNIYNPALNKYARVLRTRLRNGVLNVVQDRTDEQRIIHQLEEKTQELEAHKNLLDSLLQHSPAGISITQVIRDEQGAVVDGRTILANEPAICYSGISREDYLSKTVRELDPYIWGSVLYQMVLHTLETGKPFFTQYFYAPEQRWLELSVAKMDDDHLINVFMDVTSTKEAQLRQQKLVEELQRSNQDLEEFAYAASHDLKEPIRKVLFFSDRLRHRLDGRLDDEDLRMFSRLEAANKRMGNLVDDLLNYSQVSQRPEQFGTVNLNELLQGILDDLELEIEERKAIIHMDTLATVRGHQRQLQQLFQNLVSNALKYNKPGVPPEVRISCTITKGQETGLHLTTEELPQCFYTVGVRDNGIGFDQKDAERIFQVFQRLHGNSEYRGTGVGLAIARKVAQNHGGYIRAQSKPGEGSFFEVFLPVQAV
ncbi:His Kinase A (phospho-acceptor) domain-containing protein [Cnuella takakiae]|uniref:histidine kinase n=1 Tax=Cnuella takakiae TaxID=1302690 RepID=A0A1M5CTA0_9BACT|nr:ATP-binding protein [Cnuella takakiae]OLY91933.1 hypothetical protein BUE76_08520 [Cnuella takakiae]SHF57896.1 His Kinase A (phospho-acceptor) domain-containing protein [Cnuella takakiae]